MIITLAPRLGVNTNISHRCVSGAWTDSRGYQVLSCGRRWGRLPAILKRTWLLNGIIREWDFRNLAPSGSSVGSREIIDSGCDFCVCAVAASNISTVPKGAANEAERQKSEKHRKNLPEIHCLPLGSETFGFYSKETSNLLSRINKTQLLVTGERCATIFLRQRNTERTLNV